jgi:hypothetical protein
MNVSRRKISTEANVLERRIRFAAPVGAAEDAQGNAEEAHGAEEAQGNAEEAVLRGPATPALKDAWSIGEELILLSQREASRHHAEFWLFLLDMSPQVDPDAGNRQALMRALGIDDLFHADELLADFAEREKIPHEILAPKLLAFAQAHQVLLHGFKGRPRNSGHWNESGHEAAGHLMAQKLSNCSTVLRNAGVAALADGPQACETLQ